jgi:hypothetical protein
LRSHHLDFLVLSRPKQRLSKRFTAANNPHVWIMVRGAYCDRPLARRVIIVGHEYPVSDLHHSVCLWTRHNMARHVLWCASISADSPMLCVDSLLLSTPNWFDSM